MKKTLIICLLVLLYNCDTDSYEGDDTVAAGDPTRVNLIFPYQGSLCNKGSNVTQTESTVLFEWGSSSNTDNYTLKLKNLTTGSQSTHQTEATEMFIVLNRATPYEWYVISESNSVTSTTQSDLWQFYNAGEGAQNYAPFPAEIISPTMAETMVTIASEITLDWDGSDVDDDIMGYDVYFGTSEIPQLYINDTDESSLAVSITTNIYYWRIITKDSQGNTSNSGIYQFRIQ